MFDSGELIVIALVAFLVFGPKRFPELAKTLGKLMHEIREGMRNATVEIKKEYEEIEKKQENDSRQVQPGEEKNVEHDQASEGIKHKE